MSKVKKNQDASIQASVCELIVKGIDDPDEFVKVVKRWYPEHTIATPSRARGYLNWWWNRLANGEYALYYKDNVPRIAKLKKGDPRFGKDLTKADPWVVDDSGNVTSGSFRPKRKKTSKR